MNITQIDFFILDFIRDNISNPILDIAAKAISFTGELGWIWILLIIIMLCMKKFRKAGIAMALAMVLGLIVGNGILKLFIGRTRPYDVNTAIEIIIAKPIDFSFPSGHTLSSFAAASALFSYHKRVGIIAIVYAGLMGLSRIYLYVHYPSDVLVGSLLGILLAFAAVSITDMLFKKFQLDKKLKIISENDNNLSL